MNDLGNSNGLQIQQHETEPTLRIHMFINGQYTHWVEYDVAQMSSMVKSFQKELKIMQKKVKKEPMSDPEARIVINKARKVLEGKDG